MVLKSKYEAESFYGRVLKIAPGRISLKAVSLATLTSPFDIIL